MRLPWRATPAASDLPDLGADPTPDPQRLRMLRAHQNLLVTPDGLWSYYLLGGLDWPLQTQERRADVYTQQAFRWADLVGRRVWLRGMSSPFPHRAYARRLYQDSPRALPDQPGAQSFEQYVDAAQRHILALDARRSLSILGVHITDQTFDKDHLPLLLSDEPLPGRLGDLERTRRELRTVTAAVARPGFAATPISARLLRWVTHASLGMGMPVPAALIDRDTQGWDEGEVPSFTGPVVYTRAPYAPTTTVRALRDSKTITRHVAVLHTEDFGPRNTDRPDLDPFLAWTQTIEEHVDFCMYGYVMNGRDLKGRAERDRRFGVNIARHWQEHGEEPPAQIGRGIERSREVEDETTNGTREIATRFRGVLMLAVTGDSEEQALQRAADVTVQAEHDQSITLVQDLAGQAEYYRAFTPGEVVPTSGHVTQMPVYFLATGVPNATSASGDPSGMLLGNVAGSHDVFVFDPNAGPKMDFSGVVGLGAAPGGGKSSLLGALADHLARRGIPTVAYDPSGPLAALCGLPHLRGATRHLDLSGAQRGVLVPHLLVPEPRRVDFDTDKDWDLARREAATERMQLAADTLRDLLPYRMVTADQTGAVQGVIESAVAAVGGEYGVSPWQLIDQLTREGDMGRQVAKLLTARANLDGGLIFPDRDVNDDVVNRMFGHDVLTVVTMQGLTLPPKDQTDRSLWSRQALASVPILNLGSRLAMRAVYTNRDPKAVLMDELGISTGGAGSFSSFLVRASADSRKRHAFVALAFQNPRMLLDLDPQISNLLGAAFIGGMDEDAARSALPLLRLKEDCGYERVITTLDTGEFLVRDWQGRIRKVLVDRDWWTPDLIRALDTTAGGEGTYSPVLDDIVYAAGVA